MNEQVSLWRKRIREFIEANMNALDDDVELADDDNIFGKGYVTSLFAMRLLKVVETISGKPVADDDIVLKNFSSVNAMIALIQRQQVEA
jgi:acyl carrier protein